MTDMTLGQRIAAERKKLGISQEGLGEQTGVSRQAISKWEADGAVPEIDKLIVLSKLFGVSVGWLLGVEDAAVPSEQADALTDEQLYMIEEIVKKYRPKPVKLGRISVLAICLILTLTTYVYRLQSRIDTMNYAYDTLQSQYIELRSRVQQLEDTRENPSALSLFGDYDLEIAQFTAGDAPRVDIRFSAMPNLWKEGDSAYLTVTREGMESVRVDCIWNGAWLFGTVPLEIADGYAYCVTIVHADGTQEQQIVTDAECQNLTATLGIKIEILGKGYSLQTDPLAVTNLQYTLTMPEVDGLWKELTWKSVELVLVTSSGKELARHTLLDAKTETNTDILHSFSIGSENVQILFENLQLPENEGILLWLRAELSNGLSSEEEVFAWVIDNEGKLRKQ